jgi:hypothetical protein
MAVRSSLRYAFCALFSMALERNARAFPYNNAIWDVGEREDQKASNNGKMLTHTPTQAGYYQICDP